MLAALVGIPVGLLGAVYLAEFAGATSAFFVRYATDLLNGVPSIVIGIFAYTVVVLPTRSAFPIRDTNALRARRLWPFRARPDLAQRLL